MSPQALLYELRARGAELAVVAGDLKIRAPRGALGPELIASLKANKQALVALLAAKEPSERESAPLTGPQRQILFQHCLCPTSDAFSVTLVARIRESTDPLDVAALEASLRDLVRRHGALRTRFERSSAEPRQWVLPLAEALRSPVLSRAAGPLRTPEELATAATSAPFDLDRGPLFRATLHEHGAGQWSLVLCAHHIVLDGFSARTLLKDLGQLYAARRAGLPGAQPDPPQLSDWARERTRRAASPSHRQRLTHWVETLRGLPCPAPLPSDHLRDGLANLRGARVEVPLSAELRQRLDRLQRETGATPASALIAATVLVLSRWSGSRDLAVGVPVTTRPRSEYADTVGMFVDTVVVRVPQDGLRTVRDLLDRTSAASLTAYEHATVPLDEIVDAVSPSRTHVGSPFFQAMVNPIAFVPPRLALPGLHVEVDEYMPGARFDLTLYGYLGRDDVPRLAASYATDLFERPRVLALLEQIRAVLTQATLCPDLALDDVRLAVSDDSHVDVPSSSPSPPLPERLASVARTHRTAVALGARESECSDETWTYARLAQLEDEVRRALDSQGLSPGEPVALEGARSAGFVAAVRATLSAGRPFVVLDADQGAQRRAEIQEALGPRVLIDRHGRARRIPGADGPRPLPDGTAYVSFTSGTTGRPRGIRAHRSPLDHFFDWYPRRLELGPEDRFALLSGLSHDPALRDILTPAVLGAQLHLPPQAPGRMGASLTDWLRDNAITVLHMTPSLARLLAEGATAPLNAVRRIVFGGEPVRPDDVLRWRAIAPSARLFNAYGATETPQIASIRELGSDITSTSACVPIGRGAPGCRVVIENPAGTPTGIGELGEVVIHGRQIAAGYLNGDDGRFDTGQDGLRADAAAPTRFRTGDLGRLRPDGGLELAGRVDRQVKLRGERVELAAVEAALQAHPSVSGAAADVREDAHGETALVAWIAAEQTPAGRTFDTGNLLEWLRHRLPPAAVPSRLGCLRRLPVDARGKVDRAALASLAFSPAEEAADAPPRGVPSRLAGLEQAVATIWEGALDVERVGAHDDFFALGGHSLMAVRVLARIRESLDVVVPLAKLFQAPKLREFCAHVSAARTAEPVPALETVPESQRVPVTAGQMRMWRPETGPPFLITRRFAIRSGLECEALSRALALLEQRHDALRTTFARTETGYTLAPRAPRDDVLLRLSEEPEPDEGPDLANDSPWRARVWPSPVGGEVFELTTHHAAVDGLAFGQLCDELSVAYAALRSRSTPRLRSPSASFRELAAWQRRCEELGTWRAQLDFWGSQLRDTVELRLPTDGPAPAPHPTPAGVSELRLTPDAVASVARRARESATTPFAVFAHSWSAALAHWCGTDDVCIATPVGARRHPRAEGVVGMFVNRVFLRFGLLADRRASLASAARTVLNALANADPAAELLPVRPRIQAFFNMLDIRPLGLALEGVDADPLPPAPRTARFPLALYAVTDQQGMRLVLVHDAGLFSPARAAAIVESVATRLH